MKILFYLLLAIILLFGISFALLNASIVNFHYYFGTRQLPLSLLLGLSFSLGILIGWLLNFSQWLRAKRTIFSLKSRGIHDK